MAGLPSALTTRGSTPSGKNGLTVAPEAAMPATTTPSTLTGIPPAPGNSASGDAWANPAATGGAIVVIRCRCSELGICWVAEIQALDRARAIPPGPPGVHPGRGEQRPGRPHHGDRPAQAELLGLVHGPLHQRAGPGQPEVPRVQAHGQAPTML